MKVIKWLDKYFEIAYMMVALVTIVLVISAQIFSRKILGTSLAWSEEMCRHLFLIMGIWGIGLTIKEDSAIKFDLILNFLPDSAKAVFGLISYTIVLVFFAMLIKPAFNVTFAMRDTTATVMPYSMSLVYAIVAIGVISTTIRALQQVIRHVKLCFFNKPNGKADDREEVAS